MKSSRVIYVENDPVLRKMLSELLSDSKKITFVGIFGNSSSALNQSIIRNADVALLDFALDPNGINGVELGIAMREINEYLGLVIYSQYSVENLVSRVPKGIRHGWSFIDKSAQMELSDYEDILTSTASGKGNWEEIALRKTTLNNETSNIYFRLTPRQRSIMALVVEGKTTLEISSKLGITYSYARKELSRAYRVLLPDADSASDLRTAAAIKYVELMNL